MKVELYDERINVHQGRNKTGSSHRGRGAGEQENPIQIHFIPPDLSNLDTVYPATTVSTRFSPKRIENAVLCHSLLKGHFCMNVEIVVVVLNCQKCYQCLKGCKPLGFLFEVVL